MNYFKIDIENEPQLALHHLSLDFRPFLHSHSCCSSPPITRTFLQSAAAGPDLPLFACSYLHLDWTPATAPGNRRISTLHLLTDFISISFMSKVPSLSTYFSISWRLIFIEFYECFKCILTMKTYLEISVNSIQYIYMLLRITYVKGTRPNKAFQRTKE